MPVALPCLCLDGSRRDRVRGGVWDGERWTAELELAGNPAETTTPLAEALLGLADLSLPRLGSVAVNLGPGSILGIRATAATALAWSALLGVGAHGWSGHRAAAHLAGEGCDGVVSEGRDAHWMFQRVGAEGPEGPLREVKPADVARLRLRPVADGFRLAVPAGLGDPIDAWPSLPALFRARGLPGLTDRLEALNAPGAYALWSGERHPRRPA